MQIKGNLVVATDVLGNAIYEAKWRCQGRQVKRRLGPAWLEDDGDGWQQPTGRCPHGLLSRDGALVAMRETIAAWQAQQAVLSARAEREALGAGSFLAVAYNWLQRAERRGRKISTTIDYRYAIETYYQGSRTSRLGISRAPFADWPIDTLAGDDTVVVVRAWFESMPIGRTREKLQMVTNSVLKYAVAQGWCAVNVMDRIDREPVSYDPSDYDFYSPAEITMLLNATANRRNMTIYAIAAYAGLRCGEILALRWADIDFQQARIIVRGNISYGKLVTPKGNRQRVVPLQPKLAAILADYKSRRNDRNDEKSGENLGQDRPRFLGSNRDNRYGKDFIFPGVNQGEFHNPSTLRRSYAADVKRAGLRPLPLHSLRHSFGSMAVNVASLVQVRDWLGHRDLRTTSRYLHSKSAVSDAELLGAAF